MTAHLTTKGGVRHMATLKRIVPQRCGISCVVAMCLVLLMLGHAVSTQATDRTEAISGATFLAGLRVESQAPRMAKHRRRRVQLMRAPHSVRQSPYMCNGTGSAMRNGNKM